MNTLPIYHYGERNEYLGSGEADPDPLARGQFLVPRNATPVPMVLDVPEGQEARFDAVSSVWYLAELPPPPEPDTPPELTPEEIRRADILAELAAIDQRSIRPLREGDADRVAELEAQAEALRVELRALP